MATKDIYEKLPGICFTAGGFLVGAFAGRLPEAWQDFGLLAGVVIALFGILLLFTRRTWPALRLATEPVRDLLFSHLDAARQITPAGTSHGQVERASLRFARGQNVRFADLLMFEFPNDVIFSTELLQVGPLADACYANFMTAQDLEKRVSYNVIHIPKNANAESALNEIAADFASLRHRHTTPIDRKYGQDTPIAGEKLACSDRVFVFHEGALSEEQKKSVWNKFKIHGAITVFRGPEYIDDMWKKYGPREE